MMKYFLLFSIAFFAFFSLSNAKDLYVNDASTSGDVFCKVLGVGYVGASGNTGLTPNSPKRNLREVWPLIAAGDVVYIDKGTYGVGGSDGSTNQDLFDLTISNVTFVGAGIGQTIFDNNFSSANTDYFMEINANNITLRNMTVTNYQANAPNSGVTFNGVTTGAQAITVFGGTGILIENVNLFDNGNNGNAALTIGPNTTITLRGGGSNCNATGSSYSGGVDVLGDNVNVTISNYIISYNSKSAFRGPGLYIFGTTASTIVKVNNTSFYNNSSNSGGAGIYLERGNLTVQDCIIDGNTSAGNGGPYNVGTGIAIVGGIMKITRSIIKNNVTTSLSAARYGGIGVVPSIENVILNVDSCSFSGNSGFGTVGRDIGARMFTGRTFAIAINRCTFSSVSPIRYGDGTNACTGNTLTIQNSGNPTITYGGSGPVCAGGLINTNAPNYVPNPTIPIFSGPCSNFILPLEFLSFEAKKRSENEILLRWETAKEVNVEAFYIERSADGVNFETIKELKANNAIYNAYDYLDQTPMSGDNYYRVRFKDSEGSNLCSKIAHVKMTEVKIKPQLFPNPSQNNEEVKLLYFASENSDLNVAFISSNGEVMKTEEKPVQKGKNEITFDLKGLTKGIYTLRIYATNGETNYLRLSIL